MGLKEILIPPDKVYFELFDKEIDIAISASIKFRDELLKNLQDAERYARELKELEKKSDDIVHDIYVELGKTFITPFEHEDISRLASILDDITDYIEAAGTRVHLYKIRINDPYFERFANVLVDATKELKAALALLSDKKHFKRISKHLIEVNRLENVGDEILHEAIAKVYDNDDIKLIIKLKECYEMLEIATDKCESVTHILEDIVIKYG